MKFALGFLICCLLVIVGGVILAPESAHKIINKIQDTLPPAAKTQMRKKITKRSNNEINKTTTTTQKSFNIDVTDRLPIDDSDDSAATPQQLTDAEKQVLDWLRASGCQVKKQEGGIYQISWEIGRFAASLSWDSLSDNYDRLVWIKKVFQENKLAVGQNK